MNLYFDARKRNPSLTIHVHPLLLSLAETINASETNPDISTISENDERVLGSKFYTSPTELPPLEIHISGQTGPSLLSNQNGHILTSVAGCRECMPSAPQDNSGGEGNVTQGNSAATLHALEDNLAHTGSTSLSTLNRGKKRRRASSGGQGSLPNTRGPKVAGVIRKAKGKQAQKAGSRDVFPSLQKESLTNPPRKVEIRRQGYVCSLEFLLSLLMTMRCSLKAQTVI
jgi:hypothetical protein